MAAQRRKKPRERGRRSGGHNKGYWFWKGRGWYATDPNGKTPRVPLLSEQGEHLKSPEAEDEAKRAYARWLLAKQEQAKRQANGDSALVLRVVQDYLAYCKTNNRISTFNKRGEYLFDFCYGLPARFWDYDIGRKTPKATEADKIHNGYGRKRVGELIPMDVQQWLDKHPSWAKGTRRIAAQGLKRALNYAVAMGRIERNPIRGFKVGTGGKRVTYFTDKMEEKLIEYGFPAFNLAVKVCIRTGARYGSEFAKLTARHVEETAKGMVWKFSPEEAKTHKPRTIFVANEIAEIVRPLMKKYPSGPLFRNARGKPWTIDALRRAFFRLKDRLVAHGITLDNDGCMYTCRHTFAKRTLGGYWTGKPCTIEQLAGLMGNTRQVCWDHYSKWCEAYTDPLWEAINGSKGG
jgi:integrase